MSGEGAMLAGAPGVLDWTAIAARIARWRTGKCRTNGDAIAEFGVGLATLTRIEDGELQASPELAARICRAVVAVPLAKPPAFALSRVGAVSQIAMFLDGEGRRYSIDQAKAMHAELGDLLAIEADPRRFSE